MAKIKYTRVAAAVSLAAALAGCRPEPVPELLAVAASPETPPAISGETLAQCEAAMNRRKGVPYVETAVYSPGATYKAASRIHQAFGSRAEHADRLRAYRAERHTEGIFGPGLTLGIYCFYELQDGRLRYVDSIGSGKDDRISSGRYASLLRKIHRKMSNRNRPEGFLAQ